MLKHHNSSAIVAVSDLKPARAFYSDVLGLELDEGGGGEEGVLTFRTGATRLVVSASAEAGHNRANAVVWGVGGEIDAIVAALKSAGAAFEHYPEIGPFADGVHRVGGMKLVWLKDPDGNILHINSM